MPRLRTPTLLPPSSTHIARAARLLRDGKLVAFPTETVYGLGGDATSDRAVAAIYVAKARPTFNPLIAHVPSLRDAERLVVFDARARKLARRFWPGPLTLVLARRPDAGVSWLVSAGLDTLAVRVPAHPIARRLLKATGRPVAAPSANRSGRVSPTAAAHVIESFAGTRGAARLAMIIDGGPCEVGLESTVIDLSGPQAILLRPGGVPREDIERLIGKLASPSGGPARSPGQLKSHYAPQLKLRLRARPRSGEAFLAFGRTPRGIPAEAVLNLSPRRDLAEAAANLFAMLRALDRPKFRRIAVAPIPERGLGAAINDRLRRAAAPRR
ncbi:MAG TPA: L-threonylcarbamoyladenylate synthase [Alphaproteobacteria bacterium]|nr:L-threonylcarbamoyladenylate synthase [Alphaproteobacteria bacterium]